MGRELKDADACVPYLVTVLAIGLARRNAPGNYSARKKKTKLLPPINPLTFSMCLNRTVKVYKLLQFHVEPASGHFVEKIKLLGPKSPYSVLSSFKHLARFVLSMNLKTLHDPAKLP